MDIRRWPEEDILSDVPTSVAKMCRELVVVVFAGKETASAVVGVDSKLQYPGLGVRCRAKH